MKFMKRIAVILAAVLILSMTAFAAESSLTVRFTHEEEPVIGAEFQLYLVGEADEKGNVSLDEKFGTSEDLYDLSQSEWKELSQTLSGQVYQLQMEPVAYDETDGNGEIKWEGLKDGLYLVIGLPCAQDDVIYTPEAYLMALPVRGSDGSLDYDPVIEPKFEVREEEKVTYEVVKIWKNVSGSNHPSSVQVQLFKNGSVYDTVTLNKSNDWKYKWTDLDADASWTLAEKVPSGYTCKVSLDKTTFVVTNTRNGTTPTEPNEDLPDTGQLQWPVPVLAIAGMLLFLAGWMRRRESAHEERD